MFSFVIWRWREKLKKDTNLFFHLWLMILVIQLNTYFKKTFSARLNVCYVTYELTPSTVSSSLPPSSMKRTWSSLHQLSSILEKQNFVLACTQAAKNRTAEAFFLDVTSKLWSIVLKS